MKSSREIALEALIACRKDKAWSDGFLKGAIRQNRLDARDAALATKLCYGVLQNDKLLDFYIGQYCSQKPKHLEPLVLDLLRLGAYQILFLTKVPQSAAVNETVNLAKKYGIARASGIINAVLRKISANKDALPEIPHKDDPARWMSVKYSHPVWLIKRLMPILGRDGTEEYLKCNNTVVPTTIQTNVLKTTNIKLSEELSAAGIDVTPHPWLDGCFKIEKTGNIEWLPAFREGRFIIQDAGAKLVADVAGAKRGMKVIDVCAAPGGKSFACAVKMENNGSITDFDIHKNKIKLIDEGAARLGISIITAEISDGKKLRKELCETADIVIADVPCSGLGIIRKKPDIRRKTEKEIEGLSDIQLTILSNASRYVKRGGILVYSTCTVLPEENEQVIAAFLESHSEYCKETFTLPEPIGTVDSGDITLWPQKYDTDGFYICKLRKK